MASAPVTPFPATAFTLFNVTVELAMNTAMLESPGFMPFCASNSKSSTVTPLALSMSSAYPAPVGPTFPAVLS
jgi:hypothetical protein